MVTKQRLIEILTEVVHSPGSFDKVNLEKAVDKILDEFGWQSIDTIPRNRPILVYAYSSADHPESDKRHYFAVEWDSNWEQYVLGYALDRDGSYLYAIDPIRWMEIEDDN